MSKHITPEVGQVWQNPKNKTDTIAITVVDKRAGRKQSDWLFSYIWNDGEVVCADDEYFVKRSRKLIAEYPTWQEAVNSKEFKGE